MPPVALVQLDDGFISGANAPNVQPLPRGVLRFEFVYPPAVILVPPPEATKVAVSVLVVPGVAMVCARAPPPDQAEDVYVTPCSVWGDAASTARRMPCTPRNEKGAVAARGRICRQGRNCYGFKQSS